MFIPTLLKGFEGEHDRLILHELCFLYTPVNCKNLVLSEETGLSTPKSQLLTMSSKLVFDPTKKYGIRELVCSGQHFTKAN